MCDQSEVRSTEEAHDGIVTAAVDRLRWVADVNYGAGFARAAAEESALLPV